MLTSCTKAVIDELMLDDQDAMQLVVAMAKTGRISADPTPENIVFTRSVWRDSNQEVPNFDESPIDELADDRPAKAPASVPKNRLSVLGGQSISSVIRWLGQQGVTVDQARVIVDKLGGQETKTTGIRTFINEGKRGVGTIASISDQQKKQLFGGVQLSK